MAVEISRSFFRFFLRDFTEISKIYLIMPQKKIRINKMISFNLEFFNCVIMVLKLWVIKLVIIIKLVRKASKRSFLTFSRKYKKLWTSQLNCSFNWTQKGFSFGVLRNWEFFQANVGKLFSLGIDIRNFWASDWFF